MFTKSENLEAAKGKCMEYLDKYSNSYKLKFKIAGLFFLYSYKSGSDSGCEVMHKFAAKLLEDVVNTSEDMKITEVALFQLGVLYSSFEEYDKALDTLNGIETSQCDPETIKASIYLRQNKQEEGRAIYEHNILKAVNDISLACIGLANSYEKFEKDYEQSNKFHKLSIAILIHKEKKLILK